MAEPNTELLNIKEDVLPNSSVRVIENEEGEKSLEITLIESGWSKNGFYYSPGVAESVADHVRQRNKMYIDHDNSWDAGPSRSLRDWAATISESWKKDGRAVAKAVMTSNPETQWIYEEAKRNPENVGASIDAVVKIQPYEPEEGEELTAEEKMNRRYIVEEVRFLNSTDFVTYASAGGVVNKVLNSFENPHQLQNKMLDIFQKLNVHLEQLNNNKTPKRKNKESDMAEKNDKPTLTLESVKSDHPEIFKAIKDEITQTVKEDYQTVQEFEATISTLKEEKKALEDEKASLEKERDDLKIKVDNFEAKEAARSKREKIDGFIKESKLDPEYVSDIFVQDLMRQEKDEDIKTRIEERVKLVSTSSTIVGNGNRTKSTESEEVEELDDDSLVSALKN